MCAVKRGENISYGNGNGNGIICIVRNGLELVTDRKGRDTTASKRQTEMAMARRPDDIQ